MINKEIKIPFRLFNFIVSAIFLFNNAYFIKVYNYENLSLNFSYYILVFLSFYVINYILYSVCFYKIRIFKCISLFLVLLTFVTGYYSNKYKLDIDAIFIINTINELTQIKEVISIKDLLILLSYLLLVVFLYKKIKIQPKIVYKSIIIDLIIVCIIFIFIYGVFKSSYTNLFHNYRGINKVLRQETTLNIYPYKYFYIIKEVIKFYKNTPTNQEILATIKEGDIVLNKNHKDTITIFLMSDSIRAKNTSLLGYKLDTTPKLKNLYDKKAIYVFKQNVCFTATFISLNCMLSLKVAKDFRKLNATDYFKEKITKYFNYLKIDTYYLYNNEVNFFYNGYKHVPFSKNTPILDKELLPFLFESINNNDSKFITVNFRGAHIPYDLMLEDKFQKFPQDYDNKILQTDSIWVNIIEYLSKHNTPVFAIFTADHG